MSPAETDPARPENGTEAAGEPVAFARPVPERELASLDVDVDADEERDVSVGADVEERADVDAGEAAPPDGAVADGEAEAGFAAPDVGNLPDLSTHEALESALEALLLVVDSPVGEESLAGALEQPVDRVTEALRSMAGDLTDRNSGIDLRRVAEGWRLYTRDVYAPFVEKLLLDGQRAKLTRAALETLAVVAYRQPVTRARVAAVRGVNVDGVTRTLLARGLIEETGTDPETTGTLYVTTELFLERLGLSSLSDLPPIAPLLPEVDTIDDI